MMVTTHILISILFSLPFITLLPESAELIILTAIAGGLFPDLDLLIGEHRKTLHFPIYGTLLSIPLLALTLITTNPIIILLTIFILGITTHSLSDPLSCGLEPYPWKQTATKSVYNHYHNKWWKPKYLIPYDGSPKDFAITTILSIITLNTQTPHKHTIAITLVIIGVIYTVLRQKLPQLEHYLHKKIPPLRPFLNSLH